MTETQEPAHINQSHEYCGIVIPNIVLDSSIDAMRTFNVRPDDVWIVTYPKSGTHWMMEIVGLIIARGIPEKIDRSLASSTIEMINTGQPFPATREEELSKPMDMTPFMDRVDKAPSPRVIITHLPLQLLPPTLIQTGKVIYVARNPKDSLNSMYNMLLKEPVFDLSWESLLEAFVADKASFGPWGEHNIGFWNFRDEENVLFLFYENIKQDPVQYVRHVAEHINVKLSDDELQKVVEHSSFSGMKKTYSNAKKSEQKDFASVVTNFSFMNKGVSGQWKNRFTVAQNDAFNKWFQEKTAGSEIIFQFE